MASSPRDGREGKGMRCDVTLALSQLSLALGEFSSVRWTSTLTLPMPRPLSSKAQGCKDVRKPSKPCHIGIHWIDLAEYSQMSTHLPGFQSFFKLFASFSIGKLSTTSKRVDSLMPPAAKNSLTLLLKSCRKKAKLRRYLKEICCIRLYQQIPFIYYVKSFLIPKLLSKAS